MERRRDDRADPRGLGAGARRPATTSASGTATTQGFRRSIACDGRETVPATIALVRLACGDPRRTVCYAADFGRDTDTIACMAGSIAGALAGASAFPEDWLAKVTREASRDQLELARALVGVAGRKAAREIAAWRPLLGAE